nr:MAG TPA: hypothetical protein [Caudoviricetes sp.]
MMSQIVSRETVADECFIWNIRGYATNCFTWNEQVLTSINFTL